MLDTPGSGSPDYVLILLHAEFLYGEPEEYSLWVAFIPEADAEALPAHALIARARVAGVAGYFCEAQNLPAFQQFLLARLLRPKPGDDTGFRVRAFPGAETIRTPARPAMVLLDSDPEEFALLADGRLYLRWFRRLREEARQDLEIVRELKSRFPKARVPACLTRADYEPPRVSGKERSLGYILRLAHAERTASDLAAEALRHSLRVAVTSPRDRAAPTRGSFLPPRVDFQSLAPELQDFLGGSWAEFAHLLGRRLAELHRALARCGGNPNFTPESFTFLHQNSLYHSIRGRLRRALAHPERIAKVLPAESAFLPNIVAVAQPNLFASLHRLIDVKLDGQRLRVHGNPRLDRILFTGKDFVFTGFDGPPWLERADRELRFCPLHDVAGVLRELLHSPAGASLETEELGVADGGKAPIEWANHWADLTCGLFLDGYFDGAGAERWFPAEDAGRNLLLEAYLIERLAYEVQTAATDPLRAAEALRELSRAGMAWNDAQAEG
jgi:maltose alpha-D-glucosyltransferase/alpha-amylase